MSIHITQHFAEGCDWWFILGLADADEVVTAVSTPAVENWGARSSAMVSGVLIYTEIMLG